MAESPTRSRRGLMLVISSPSGAGKSTLARRLIADFPDLAMSVSATTRAPRLGEENGREYHFVTHDRFAELIATGDFLEHAEVHEHRYGSPKSPVMAALEAGRDVLFDIDWQGAMAIAAAAQSDVVRIFVLPPSLTELSRRLHSRAQDAADVIERRMGRAKGEIRYWAEYDYVLLNDDLERTYKELVCIYQAEQLRRARNPWLVPFVTNLLDEEF